MEKLDEYRCDNPRKVIHFLGISLLLQSIIFMVMSEVFNNFDFNTGHETSIVAILALIPLLFYSGIKNVRKNVFNINKKFGIKEIIVAFSICLIFNTILSYAIDLLDPFLSSLGFNMNDPIDDTTNVIVGGEIFYSIIIAPIVEEIIYRGVVMKTIEKYNYIAAIIISSILFGSMHQNLSQSFVCMGIGLILGYIGYKYSIIFSIIIHILNNAMVEISSFLNTNNTIYANNFDNIVTLIAIVVILIVFIFNRKYIINDINSIKKDCIEYKNDEMGISYLFKTAFKTPTIMFLFFIDLFFIVVNGLIN